MPTPVEPQSFTPTKAIFFLALPLAHPFTPTNRYFPDVENIERREKIQLLLGQNPYLEVIFPANPAEP